ncbi:MAG: hypothetical protein K2Q18_15085 [Bdellovibrionales bacterium]|nr:hypothetical protein [Bdellovibrionales bacterium]
MKRLLHLLVIFAVVSCGVMPVNETNFKLQDFSYEKEIYSSTYDKVDKSPGRSVAEEETCVDLIEKILKIDDSNYSAGARNADPFSAAQAEAKATNAFDKYPVAMSNEMRKFRDRFLGWFKDTAQREPLIRSFEAALRMQSELTKEAILKNKGTADYDLVIVGTGVHGVIALHEALAKNPNLKILLVDEGDTAGATFRYGKEVFNINSSNRASGIGSRPLPGEGNINELPGLPIQVSDLTGVKYPTANDLGTSIVAGLYAAVREHPNVNLLFGTSAKELMNKTEAMDPAVNEGIRLVTRETEKEIEIGAQKIILTTGLGKPGVPPKVATSLIKNPEIGKISEGSIPKVVNFEDLVRMLAMSNDPVKLIKDKKIAIVGKGDSANVLIEYLLGYAAREGYGGSTAQDGRASKIFWIGQDKKDCKDFISDIRSRYQAISTGFRSSAKDLEAIITPFASKLDDVALNSRGKISSSLANGDIVPEADIVVLTTGFDQDLRSLFARITDGESSKLGDDKDFFEKNFETLEGRTSTSSKPTKIGRKYQGREIYVLGTAAGNLTVESELVGVIQNFVSIFNNAPRVVASVSQVMNVFTNKVGSIKAQKVILEASMDNENTYVIKNIQESRTMGDKTLPYLESVFKEALNFAVAKGDLPIDFRITLKKDGTLEVYNKGDQKLGPLVELLASSREFFSLTKEVLKVLKGKEIVFTAGNGKKGKVFSAFDIASAKLAVDVPSPKVERNTTFVDNKRIEFRGANVKASVTKAPEVSKVEVTKVTDLTNLLEKRANKEDVKLFDFADLSDATYRASFLPIAGGKYEVGIVSSFTSKQYYAYKFFIRTIGSKDSLLDTFDVGEFIRFIKNKNGEVVSLYNGYGEKIVLSKDREFFDTNVEIVSPTGKKSIGLKEFNETYNIPNEKYFCAQEGQSKRGFCFARLVLEDGREAVSIKYSINEEPFKLIELDVGEIRTVIAFNSREIEYLNAQGKIKRITFLNY